MRKAGIIATFITTAALVAAAAETSLASPQGSTQTGRGLTHPLSRLQPLHAQTPNSPEFHRFRLPRGTYLDESCATDLSGIKDGKLLTSISSSCGVRITFSKRVKKLSVPGSWQTWGRPPKTEDATPDVIFSNGATTLTLTFDEPSLVGGLEAEPNHFAREVIEADFWSGPDGTGELLGTIFRRRTGSASEGNARLFGVQTTTPWLSIVVTDIAVGDFGIAQIRTSAPTP